MRYVSWQMREYPVFGLQIDATVLIVKDTLGISTKHCFKVCVLYSICQNKFIFYFIFSTL